MSYFPSPMPWHDLVAIINHSIVDLLAILFNSILLLAVVLKSPSLGSYKLLLINSAIIDLLSSTSMFLSMVRIIPARHALAYVYDGPCIVISGFFCHCMYTLMLSTISQSLFNIAISFCYRLYILGRPSPSTKAVAFVCFIVSIPNLITLTTLAFMLDDREEVRAEMKVMRPQYDLDEYVVEGHSSIVNVITIFVHLAEMLPIWPTLTLIFILRRKVLAKLDASSVQMSERTAQMHSTLTKVLTLQSMLPIFYSGAVNSYATCFFEIMCSPMQEHLMLEWVSCIALFAPLITLYCMKPYKDFVVSIARCHMLTLRKNNSEESTSRTVRVISLPAV